MKGQARFTTLMKNSQDDVFFVASVLHSEGHNVRIMPAEIGPDPEHRFAYVDDGDLEFTRRIEVKHNLKDDFHSMDDFPHDGVILDEAYKIDKPHTSSLYAYIVLNKSRTAWLQVSVSSKPYWYTKEMVDSTENRTCIFVLCPKKYASFRSLVNGDSNNGNK